MNTTKQLTDRLNLETAALCQKRRATERRIARLDAKGTQQQQLDAAMRRIFSPPTKAEFDRAWRKHNPSRR